MSTKTRHKHDEAPEPTPKVPDKASLLYATLFALVVAGAVLLFFVLPAEYGLDPTGAGHVTGISKLHSQDREIDVGPGIVHNRETGAPRNDTFIFVINGLQDNEFKLHLLANQSFVYTWTSTGPVDFDFHGEPDQPSRPGEFSSYEASQGTTGSGSFQAPYTGRHGWYFQNVGPEPVTITIQTWGYYDVVGLVG